MSMKPSTSEIVIVKGERGWVITTPAELANIDAREELVKRIASCRTWGEYLALGGTEFDRQIRDRMDNIDGIEGEPDSDHPIDIDLRIDADPEVFSGFERFADLEVATGKFFAAMNPGDFPEHLVFTVGPWAFVPDEHLTDLTDVLRTLGYQLHYADENSSTHETNLDGDSS